MLAGEERVSAKATNIAITRRCLSGELDRVSNDLEAALSAAPRRRARLEAKGLLFSLARPRRFDSWAADDPRPFRRERRQVLGRLARALVSRFRRA